MSKYYLIPIRNGRHSGKKLFYSPLKGLCRLIGDESDLKEAMAQADILRDKPVLHVSTNPEKYRILMLLPNNRCNFNCSYCYSTMGRNRAELSLGTIHSALDWFISPTRLPGQKLTIIFIGGGEPMLSWKNVKKAIEYAEDLNSKREGGLQISIITNGSIISDDIISFCHEKKVSLCVSYDILEDVHNTLRSHYQEVTDNINEFTRRGLKVGLTTVITEANIRRMSEMVETMQLNIPAVKHVSFKPLVPDESFALFATKDDYYAAFTEEFFKAKAIADNAGIQLTCPYLNAVSVLQDRFCEGKAVISADGSITGCNFVSSPQEKFFGDFKIGIVDETSIDISQDDAEHVFGHNNSLELCCECPAKYHCAGGCYADHVYMSDENKEVYCRAMRLFLADYLIYKNRL